MLSPLAAVGPCTERPIETTPKAKNNSVSLFLFQQALETGVKFLKSYFKRPWKSMPFIQCGASGIRFAEFMNVDRFSGTVKIERQSKCWLFLDSFIAAHAILYLSQPRGNVALLRCLFCTFLRSGSQVKATERPTRLMLPSVSEW